MSKLWPMVKLGEAIRHRKEFITIDDISVYKRPRVQLHAQGIVLRDQVPGALIKTKTQQVCQSGEFLVAEIDAKVGGFGIVPPELAGSLVSGHYFLFVIDESILSRSFLDYCIRTPGFHEQVKAQGSTNYAAIRPSHVLNYTIPLPPLAEQRRIVARIEELAAQIQEARTLRQQATEESQHLVTDNALKMLEDIGRRFGNEPLGAHVKIQGGYAFKSSEYVEAGLPIIRIANLENELVHSKGSPCMPQDRLNEFDRFRLKYGDILIALTGPPKLGIVPSECNDWLLNQRVGRFLPIDLEKTEPRFVYWLARAFQRRIENAGYGGAQANVSSKDIEEMEFPFPSIPDQRRIVAELDALQAEVDRLKALQAETSAELDALLPSILDRAFKGEL